MISVVVPVYNVASYLPQCLDSLLSQTYKDLEIIIVNDGSTDDSPQICDSYATKDRRVKVVHKTNGGLSDARNVGVTQATGDRIYFADSDDWVDKNAILKLYEFAIANDCDIVQGNMYYAYPDYLLYRNVSLQEHKKMVLKREEAMRELIINDRIKNFAWGKLYKTCLVRNLEFPIGKFFEDSFWQHLVIDRIERYGIIDEPLYYYRQRSDSISGDKLNKTEDLLEGYRYRLAFVREHYPQYETLMRKMYNKTYAQLFPKTGCVSCLKGVWTKVVNRLCSINKYKRIPIR